MHRLINARLSHQKNYVFKQHYALHRPLLPTSCGALLAEYAVALSALALCSCVCLYVCVYYSVKWAISDTRQRPSSIRVDDGTHIINFVWINSIDPRHTIFFDSKMRVHVVSIQTTHLNTAPNWCADISIYMNRKWRTPKNKNGASSIKVLSTTQYHTTNNHTQILPFHYQQPTKKKSHAKPGNATNE